MSTRNYSSTAIQTTLTGGITGSATSMPVAATTGFPAAPFILCLEPGTANQELVLVTVVAGTTLTVTRGYDSTTGVSHNSGAVVQHSHAAIEFREANAHVNATTGVHGVSGSVVGTTDAQTLTNKILASAQLNTPRVDQLTNQGGNYKVLGVGAASSSVNSMDATAAATGNAPTLAAVGSDTNIGLNLISKGTGTVQANGAPVATTTGAQTLTNKTVDLTNNTVTGTKAQFNTAISDADMATLAGTETLTNKTLTSPTVTGQTLDGVNISGAWTPYTPTLANVTLGTGGTVTGAYMQIGKTVHVRIVITLGTGGALTGAATATLPVAPVNSGFQALTGIARDDNLGTLFPLYGTFQGGSTTATLRALPTTAGNSFTATGAAYPFTWATLDSATLTGAYEAA